MKVPGWVATTGTTYVCVPPAGMSAGVQVRTEPDTLQPPARATAAIRTGCKAAASRLPCSSSGADCTAHQLACERMKHGVCCIATPGAAAAGWQAPQCSQSLLLLTWRSPGGVKLQPRGKGNTHGDIGGGGCAAVGHGKRDVGGRANRCRRTAGGGCDADVRKELSSLQTNRQMQTVRGQQQRLAAFGEPLQLAPPLARSKHWPCRQQSNRLALQEPTPRTAVMVATAGPLLAGLLSPLAVTVAVALNVPVWVGVTGTE